MSIQCDPPGHVKPAHVRNGHFSLTSGNPSGATRIRAFPFQLGIAVSDVTRSWHKASMRRKKGGKQEFRANIAPKCWNNGLDGGKSVDAPAWSLYCELMVVWRCKKIKQANVVVVRYNVGKKIETSWGISAILGWYVFKQLEGDPSDHG